MVVSFFYVETVRTPTLCIEPHTDGMSELAARASPGERTPQFVLIVTHNCCTREYQIAPICAQMLYGGDCSLFVVILRKKGNLKHPVLQGCEKEVQTRMQHHSLVLLLQTIL